MMDLKAAKLFQVAIDYPTRCIYWPLRAFEGDFSAKAPKEPVRD